MQAVVGRPTEPTFAGELRLGSLEHYRPLSAAEAAVAAMPTKRRRPVPYRPISLNSPGLRPRSKLSTKPGQVQSDQLNLVVRIGVRIR